MSEQNSIENLGSYQENEGDDKYRNHPAIANSDLKYLYDPQIFYNYKFKPKVEEKSKSYLAFGTLFEDYLTYSKEEFDDKYLLTPIFEKEPGSQHQINFCNDLIKCDEITEELIANAYSAYYSNANALDPKTIKKAKDLFSDLEPYIIFNRKADNFILYSEQDLEKIKRMKQNVLNLPIYQELFLSGKTEVKIQPEFGIDSPITIYGVDWKGKLDFVIFDHINEIIYIVDLKTTGKPIAQFGYAIKFYKYHRQLAHYKNLVQTYIKGTKFENWTIHTRILAVETNQFNKAVFIPIPINVLEEGKKLLEEAAHKIKFYQQTNYSKFIEEDDRTGMFIIDWDNLDIYEED